MSLRVAFVPEGDANTADCWSGSGRSFAEALRAGTQVDLYDAELRSCPRAIAAALTYHPARGALAAAVRVGRGAVPRALGARRQGADRPLERVVGAGGGYRE